MVNFVGNSLFRNYNFGVINHCFEIRNIYAGPPGWMDDFCTNSCPSEYSGTLEASQAMNGNDNDLSIRPYSENDFDDYINGLSMGDYTIIYRHVNDIEYITDPYKMVAADVNNNNEIDEGDLDELFEFLNEEIIFTRNSWEWFNQKEINDNYGSFQSDPYSWTISNRYSGGIFWLNVSTSTLSSSTTQPQFFYFTTTKVGELNYNEEIPNDWVCNEYSLKSDDKRINFIRSTDGGRINNNLKIGDQFSIECNLTKEGNLFFFQLPLYFDFTTLELIDIVQNTKFHIDYQVNKSKNQIVGIYAARSLENNISFKKNESIVVLKARVLKDIPDISTNVSLIKNRKLEAGDINLNNLEPEVRLILHNEEIVSNKISFDGRFVHLYLQHPSQVELIEFDLWGRVKSKQTNTVVPGSNVLKLSHNQAFEPGIIKLILEGEIFSWFKVGN